MTEQEAITTLQDVHDVAECRIKSGDKRGVVYIPPDKLQDFNIAISALKEIQQYQALGSVEELWEAREKQIPRKPDINKVYYFCPNCGTYRSIRQKHRFCHDCGQAIDWS